MTDKNPSPVTYKPSLKDERNHPVYRAGRAVVIFMSIVWAIVVILVLYFVFEFWLG
ncbi:hypothetical protein [Neisseria iguanae]|uniref:hypothetical protein n=1 Tax=Neisseria iguanae TaxID=90242 RepID=UPI001475D460|nr:hypothetical protein [Neisseria iguanae]